MKKRHPSNGQAGLTLIEIMVALLIGTLLILGLVQVFGASRAAYQLSEGMSRTQENARFAIDFLQRDIRMAGHFGCVNDQAHWVKGEGDPAPHFASVIASGSGHPLDFSVAIQGYEVPDTAPDDELQLGEAWAAPAGLPGSIGDLGPAPGSDVLVLRYLASEGVPVTVIAPAAAGPGETLTFDEDRWNALTSDGNPAPTLYGIGDCTHADVFQGTGAAGAVTSTVATSLADRYTPQPSGQTMLYRAESVVYYVVNKANGVPALFRARATGAGVYVDPEELVEGIESMQLLFGQDQTDPITSVAPPVGHISEQGTAADVIAGAADDAAEAAQWRRVGLVQVGLLAVSPNQAAVTDPAAEDRDYNVLGVNFVAADDNDNLYRSGYEVTVALRNRLFGN